MALDCPRCKKGKLEEIEIGDVVLERCVQCSGLWFDNDEIYEVLDRRPALRKIEETIPPAELAEPDMPCPRCVEVSLRRFDLSECGDQSGTVYRCASCSGTWMDRGELNTLEDPAIAKNLKTYFDKRCPD